MRGTLEPRSWDPEKEQLLRVGAFFQGGNLGCGGEPSPGSVSLDSDNERPCLFTGFCVQTAPSS